MYILPKNNKKSSSRKQIAINSIEKDKLCLPGNIDCAIMSVTPLNFELKSEEEQDMIIDNYQAFLNAMPCPIQIVYRIKELDIHEYIDRLNVRAKKEREEVYRKQIANYTNFVNNLTISNKLLSRLFYIAVSTDFDKTASESIRDRQLELHCDIITKGLSKLGMRVKRLQTIEILELIHNFYKPQSYKYLSLSQETYNLIKKSYI